MNDILPKIQKDAAAYIGMITSVFDVNVSVIDNHFTVIAEDGKLVYPGSFSAAATKESALEVLKTGLAAWVKDYGNHPFCDQCQNRPVCQDLFRLYFPVRDNTDIIGLITIYSSDEIQHQTILQNKNKLKLFAQNISDLISLKAKEYHVRAQKDFSIKLQSKLMDLISEGVVILSSSGDILYVNSRGEKILGNTIPQIKYLKKIKQFSIAKNRPSSSDLDEYTIKIRDKTIRLAGKTYPITDLEGREDNRVFIFNDIKTLHESLLKYSPDKKLPFDRLIGKNENFLQAVTACKKSAFNDNCLLLKGESGTGKGTIAMSMHMEGPRKNNQFVRLSAAVAAFDASSDPQNAPLSSLLQNNTVYIHNVDRLSLKNQELLLNIINNRKNSNTKIICTTHADLEHLVGTGDFKQELFYNLDLFTVAVPPLRARGDDILLFMEHFLRMYNAKFGKEVTFKKEIRSLFLEYNWPGNIGEIENVIAYIVEYAEQFNMPLGNRELPAVIKEKLTSHRQTGYNLEELEKKHIIKTLNELGPVRSKDEIAAALGISHATFYRKLKKYNIRQDIFFK